MTVDDHVEALRREMAAHGIVTDDDLVPNTPMPPRRVHVGADRKGKRNGWYRLHIDGDGRANGVYGCHKRYPGEKFSWSAKGTIRISRAERLELKVKVSTDKKKREAEEKARHAAAAVRAQALWNAGSPAEDHPYLKSKNVTRTGLRVGDWVREFIDDKTGEVRATRVPNALLIPMFSSKGKLASLQAIFPDENNALKRAKDVLAGGRKHGCYLMLGQPIEIDGLDTIMIGEGYATCATAHAVTGIGTMVAFDAGNLVAVAKLLRAAKPNSRIVLLADTDAWTDKPINNPGVTLAREAAAAVDGVVAGPVFSNIDKRPTDFNDLAALDGREAVKIQSMAKIRGQTPAEAGTYTTKPLSAELASAALVSWVVCRRA